jgi:hypothetical protein
VDVAVIYLVEIGFDLVAISGAFLLREVKRAGRLLI